MVKGCINKKRYETGVDAVDHAANLLKKFGGAYRPYPCDHCKGWHLSTKMRSHRQLGK